MPALPRLQWECRRFPFRFPKTALNCSSVTHVVPTQSLLTVSSSPRARYERQLVRREAVREAAHGCRELFDRADQDRDDGAVVDAAHGAACVVGREVAIDRGGIFRDEAVACAAVALIVDERDGLQRVDEGEGIQIQRPSIACFVARVEERQLSEALL